MIAAGDHGAAAVFASAVGKGTLARLHALPTHERQPYRASLEQIRAKLGEHAYQAATEHGATMAYDELITFALDHIDLASAPCST
jgi:hypothetical protein